MVAEFRKRDLYMGRKLIYIFSSVIVIATVIQMITGNPDIRIFSFPVNISILLVLAGGLFVLNREMHDNDAVKALSSGKASVIAIALMALCCFPIALFPALEFQKSWIFNAVTLLLVSNLALAIMRYRGSHRIRFWLNHTGILIFMVSLTFGAADMKRMKAAADIGETIETAYTADGRVHPLGYSLKVESFDVEFYSNNVPSEFKAVVSSGNESRTIMVNHPWHKSWKEDIYLTGYDTEAGSASRYCILEFVVQPWKLPATAGLLLFAAGAVMLLWGGKRKRTR